MQKNVNLKINNINVTVPEGTTILEAAKAVGIKIPTLCYLKEINKIGACRVCVVEVKGARSLVASCVHPVTEGLEVFTNTAKVLDSRKKTVELLLSNHKQDCLSCSRSGNCELKQLSYDLGCDSTLYAGDYSDAGLDCSSKSLVRDNSKCILCRRCVSACQKYQSVGVIGANGRGFDTHIACAFEQPLADVACVNCGQCIAVCPTGALSEKDEISNVMTALNDNKKFVIVGTAPSVRVGLGEDFGFPIGTNVEGKMVSALKMVGFKNVFDVDFAADLTIMEEGFEFIDRVKNGGVLPMITSCSPAWVKFIEHNYPELLAHLSTAKSPQQMFGAAVKTFYAEKIGVDPKDIYVVTVMPCTAKKYEKDRPHQNAAGVNDVDAVLTTRELARLIKRCGVIFNDLTDSEFDAPLGIGSGAGLIFGATGGVMEAALRTVASVLTGKDCVNVDFKEVRGNDSVKEAQYKIGDLNVKVCVVSSLAAARGMLEKIKKGEADYHFIEVMSCPGGCINGGGQPIVDAYTRNNVDYKALRAKAIYDTDKVMKLRMSHLNPAIKAIYSDYFGKPNSEKAHHCLHTKYVARDKF